jgi:hypothetical protein
MSEIVVEHRRCIFSEPQQDVRRFAPGATIADIVATLPVAPEFATHGAVWLKRGREDPGHLVPREAWRLVRPKPGTALFVTVVPSGGDNSKSVVGVIAAIALIALTSFIGSGGLGTLLGAPLLGPGIGAQVAAAAFSVAGRSHIGALLT